MAQKQMAQEQIPVARMVREHLALKQAGVNSFEVRARMIRLAHLRGVDFEAWVKARGELSVFEALEADGESERERLTRGNGAFRRAEVSLAGERGEINQ